MPKPPNPKFNARKALTAKLSGQSYHSIAREMQVPVTTVHSAIAPLIKNLPGTEHVETYQRHQATVFDAVSSAIVNSITDADLSKASLQQKATSIAILTDKARLVSGQSTANLGISVLLQGVQSAGVLHGTAGTADAVVDAEVIED